MAEKKVDDGRVELRLPPAKANEDPNEFISINFRNYLLPKGKTSRVPKAVYDEYMRAKKAQEDYDIKAAEMAAQ